MENNLILACQLTRPKVNFHTLANPGRSPADDGKLFAFGLNQDGQLGLGHTETTFDEVTEWPGGRAVQLGAGVGHTVALTGNVATAALPLRRR